MQPDTTLDFLTWDGCEQVTYQRALRGGKVSPLAIGPDGVKGRNVRGREKSPSRGVYQGFERNWHLAAAVLPADWPGCSPGDSLVDSYETTWTVLTADLDRLRQRWQLGTVDLVLANDLSDTVQILRAELTYDPSGVAVKTYPPGAGEVLYSLHARMQPITQEIADERGLRYARGKWECILAAQVPLVDVAEDIVSWVNEQGQTVLFDIVTIRNPARIDELPVLELQERR